jgi:hypothetical protein
MNSLKQNNHASALPPLYAARSRPAAVFHYKGKEGLLQEDI